MSPTTQPQTQWRPLDVRIEAMLDKGRSSSYILGTLRATHADVTAWLRDMLRDDLAEELTQRHRGLQVLSREALVEDVEFMLATGERAAGICRRLNLSRAALERALQREDRHDLTAALSQADDRRLAAVVTKADLKRMVASGAEPRGSRPRMHGRRAA